MKKYKFYNVVFTPDEYHQIKFDDKKVHLSPLQSKLLTYLVESPGKTKEKDDILKDVWEGKERHYDVITRTISELKSKLPNTCNFTHVPRKGYAFEHDVIIEQPKLERLERLFAHSPGVKHFLFVVLIMISLAILYGFTDLYYDVNPPPRHGLENIDTLFTRNYLTSEPQVSPDGRFVAHQLSSKLHINDYLGLYDSKRGDTKPLVKMGFFDGFKWNLTGDKIVYQSRVSGKCEIRLLSFHNDDKTKFNDEPLTECFRTSGGLSFAWFNDSEFYVNFTAKAEITTDNEMPQHHLYSYNIDTKDRFKLATSEYKGGVGFYSLEYDSSNDTLYFLQTEDFVTTHFYSYHNDRLDKLTEIDYQVRFFTVDNDRLIYKNSKNQFLINKPAKDFSNSQLLLTNQPLKISQPSLKGNQLVYSVGETFHFNLQKLQDNTLTQVSLNGFSAYTLAKMDNALIFASAQTGMYQLYRLTNNGQIKQISNMIENKRLKHIQAASNVLVLNTIDKVFLYQLNQDKLQQLKTFTGYNRGILNTHGDRILLTDQKHDEVAEIYEIKLDSLLPNRNLITQARLAFYHQDYIVYLSKDHELIRLVNGKEHIITSNVITAGVEYTDSDSNDFYYIEPHKTLNKLYKVNLIDGTKSQIELGTANPTKIQVLNGQVYIRTAQMHKTLFTKGDIVIH